MKCVECGKSGLFFKTDENKLCGSCKKTIILTIQSNMDMLQSNINSMSETDLIGIQEIEMKFALDRCNDLLKYSNYSFFPQGIKKIASDLSVQKENLERRKILEQEIDEPTTKV